MTPLQFLLILRAHYKAALAVFVLTLIAGATFSYLMPKKYVATSSLVFDVRTPDPVAGINMTPARGYMETQVEIIKSDRIAQRVVETLKLDKSPSVIEDWKKSGQGKVNIQQWLGERVSQGLGVTQGKNNNIIELSYASGDPAFAATLANAYAQAYISTNIDLRVDPARQYSAWFAEQAKVMRENLEKAQERLSQYQQEHGIVAKEGEMDAEMSKLNQLVSELTAAQGQTVDIQSKAGSSEVISGFAEAGLVQSLKSDIARLEVKVKEASENLGKNHPQYQRMEAELASLKNQLEVEKLNVTRELSVSRNVSKDKERQLRAAIEAQKRKLLDLKGGHDDLAVLERDVEAARSAYDNVVKRYNQTSLESQVDQTNVSILNPAIEPVLPASPDQQKNAAITLLASVLMGVGVALLLEFLDRRVRTVRDLEDMLQVPVLAVIGSARGNNRLARLASQTLRLEFK
jgi:polysaccharide biosynthesis transport protein